MKPLHLDQIHNGPFTDLCDFIWSDDVSRSKKSGVYDYYVGISEKHGKPLVDHTNIPASGVIFVGMCHLLEEVFSKLPNKGSYIIVHRTNDRPYTEAMNAVKPSCVKHVYTVDCRGKFENVTAIPFGNASIMGFDPFIGEAVESPVECSNKLLFVRYNVNPDTPHRNESLKILRGKSFATVIEHQIPQDEFYRLCKTHLFTMALAGCGADASRQWTAIQLGSIPIVTDCPEMRHFEDLPLIYCPKDMNEITHEWLDNKWREMQAFINNGIVSTDRMRMSYWQKHLTEKRNEHGI